MKREIFKLKFWAFIKIILCSLLYADYLRFLISLYNDSKNMSLVAVIVLAIIFFIHFFIFILAGIATILKGTKELDDYIAKSSFDMDKLEKEFNEANKYGKIRIGQQHIFARGVILFYVFPIISVDKVWMQHSNYNNIIFFRGRNYYICIKSMIMNYMIKIPYMFKKDAEAALYYLEEISEKNVHVKDLFNAFK